MKFRSFVKVFGFFAVLAALGIVLGAVKLVSSCDSSSKSTQTPIPTSTPVVTPPVQTVLQTPVIAPTQPTTQEVKSALEDWLNTNGDRHGLMRQNDILPNAKFRATAIRFKDVDAVKFSNDTRQWSQFRLDLNRDGVDDEKWLLMNGKIHKREILDARGQTTSVHYF